MGPFRPGLVAPRLRSTGQNAAACRGDERHCLRRGGAQQEKEGGSGACGLDEKPAGDRVWVARHHGGGSCRPRPVRTRPPATPWRRRGSAPSSCESSLPSCKNPIYVRLVVFLFFFFFPAAVNFLLLLSTPDAARAFVYYEKQGSASLVLRAQPPRGAATTTTRSVLAGLLVGAACTLFSVSSADAGSSSTDAAPDSYPGCGPYHV